MNIQHFMLAHPILNNIPIETDKQEILPLFRLAYGFYIILPLNRVKLE